MKKIAIVLISAGLILIAYPFYQEWTNHQKVKALEKAITLISEAEEEALEELDALPFTKGTLENLMELEIPSIQLKQHVLNETTEENLNIALTQIKKDQTPGVGNFTIAGHRGYRDGRHFSDLGKVSIGEIVYLHTKDKTFVYEITSSDVIEATQIEVLDDRSDVDEITLITCTVSGLKRIAVKGQLVHEMPK